MNTSDNTNINIQLANADYNDNGKGSTTNNTLNQTFYGTFGDTFDGSKPDLVSSRTIKEIEAKLDVPDNDEGNRIINGLGSFYANYIAPNMFPLIVIGLLILYLTIKYILKRDREEREEDEEENEVKNNCIKKQMVSVDPDKLLKNIMENTNDIKNNNRNDNGNENNIENDNEDDNESENENRDRNIDISDMISDDYLLTNDDIDGENNGGNREIKITQHDANVLLQNRDSTYDIDNAALLVFGKDKQN